ncbi:MAG TPA: 4Fe-4S binding protein, partial [Methanocorpusculum sp.]|nr:4Fe-4S binding protein [Methanocorpusculum sp.]HJJ43759.1 4Fe-4S binding protein [Methanocorpusculum sp.]HJJ53273.1 4Fe-4S binding protein [Methanocorpusculum sp.]
MKLVINERRCKGCNMCTIVCPYGIFQEGVSPGSRGY